MAKQTRKELPEQNHTRNLSTQEKEIMFANHFKQAITFFQAGQMANALKNFDRVIALKPDFAEAHSNRGIVLQALGRYEEALAAFDRAAVINPGYANSYYNRGVILQELGKYEEALAAFNRAIAVKTDYASAYNNRGSALQVLGRYEEALAAHDRAIAINPASIDAHWNKSILLLLLGQYEEGWRLYEWRWRLREYLPLARNFAKPLWLGDADIRGKTIFLYHEQGLGDSIQMLRYVPLLATQHARVIVEVPSSLLCLAVAMPGVSCAAVKGEKLPEFDLQCPFMSLPLAFKTKVETIPANVPYMRVPESKRNLWKSRLGEKKRFRIGLVLSGGKAHKLDRERSIPFDKILPLLEKDAEFHSLQIEYSDSDREMIIEDKRIHDHAAEILDFGDTAALIWEMDLVISVDTSVAHLAGALGKQVWIMLPYASDFRWLRDREDSPWYPTARLLRQKTLNSWDSVLEELNLTQIEIKR